MKTIDSTTLANVAGGALPALTASTPRRTSGGSNLALQTALTGVTSALDSLKTNQKSGSLEQLLPVAIMAKWIQNR